MIAILHIYIPLVNLFTYSSNLNIIFFLDFIFSKFFSNLFFQIFYILYFQIKKRFKLFLLNLYRS
nr:MAG TPA: hypothetical protein [Caudoviricetes sp.]